MASCTLADWVEALEEIAPLHLAEEWDNVGLLVEPLEERPIQRVLLTIDLTQAVMDEAIEWSADAMVAYHPPLFGAVKRLRKSADRELVVIRAVHHGIAIYSPHTALDTAVGGVNDWLSEAFEISQARAVEPRTPVLDGGDEHSQLGLGRQLELARPLSLEECIERIKRHLGRDQVQVAAAAKHVAGEPIRRICLCAGAGGSVLEKANGDLLWTGEMRHHDVLAAQARGQSVVLCQHTHTERGYLPRLAERLRNWLTGVEFRVSRKDGDPLSLQ